MKLELQNEEIANIENLIRSRINELRDKLGEDTDKEEELRKIIRDYKKLLNKISNQI